MREMLLQSAEIVTEEDIHERIIEEGIIDASRIYRLFSHLII